MRILRSVVADDADLARSFLRAMLEAHPHVEVVAECSDGLEVLSAIDEHQPDVLFLDVEMPNLTGWDVLEAIGRERIPLVVLVTGHEHYAVKAFEVEASDFLLKPFDDARLARCIQRVRDLLRKKGDAANPPQHVYRPQLPVRSGDATRFIQVADVYWFEADGKHTLAHSEEDTVKIRSGLSQIEAQLDPRVFVRVSRSAIVNLSRIREVQRWFKGEHLLILADGTRVTTGRAYRSRIQLWLGFDAKEQHNLSIRYEN